MKKHEKYID